MNFENLEHLKKLNEQCETHHVNLYQLDKLVKIAGEDELRKPSPYCPKCKEEEKQQKEQDEIHKHLNNNLYLKTYNVLMRDSTIPKELVIATFDNFKAEATEERRLLQFAKNQVKKYLDGMTGNTIISGTTGIGKSHLSVAMAKAINEGYKAKNEPKSVLFVSLTEIIKRIKEGWNYGKGASLTEYEAVDLLKSVDYLILDDLGAKSATLTPKSDWEQDLLFDIINHRETTIINSNLSSSELKTVYNDRNASRILKGAEGNTFRVFSIKDKRFSIKQLKNN